MDLDNLATTPVTIKTNDTVRDDFYKALKKYKETRTSNSLEETLKIIINNINHPNAKDFLDEKVDDKTLFDILIKYPYDFSQEESMFILKHDDLIIKAILNKKYSLLRYATDENFFIKINGVPLIEYLFQIGEIDDFWFYRIRENTDIIEIVKKYNRPDLLMYTGENILFSKYDDNKLVIDYLLENSLISPPLLFKIKENTQIIDYLIKYNRYDLLCYISPSILMKERNNKIILEDLLSKGIQPHILEITSTEMIDILLKYGCYYALADIPAKYAFYSVPNTNESLFEFLLKRDILCHNAISEIYKNERNAEKMYKLIYDYKRFDALVHFDEDRLLLNYGQRETVLESILRSGNDPQVDVYTEKKSMDILLQYGRYDLLQNCNEDLLLRRLPNGKKLYEELFDRGYEINTLDIKSQEIAHRIFQDERYELVECLSVNVMLSFADLEGTYLDKFLKFVKEQDDISLMQYCNHSNADLKQWAQIYISYLRHDLYSKMRGVTITGLTGEIDGTTLLEEMLKIDKDLTYNKFLTEEQKANVDVSMILRLYGIKHKVINFDNLTKHISNIYLKEDVDKRNQMPITKEQEQLLKELYDVMNDGLTSPVLLETLIASYRYLLSTNNPHANEIHHLIDIKRNQPDFRLELTDDSSYDIDEQYISLETPNVDTLNHEIGHALYCIIDGRQIPQGFEELINKKRHNLKFRVMVSLYTRKYHMLRKKVIRYVDRVVMREYDRSITKEQIKEIEQYLNNLKEKQMQAYIDRGYDKELLERLFKKNYTVKEYLSQLRKIKRTEMVDSILRIEHGPFISIGDYFDGILGGKLRDGKIMDMLGFSYLKGGYGHGEEYYAKGILWVFDEMMANYSEIMKSKKPEEGIKELRKYLGDDLIDMVATYYNNYVLNNTYQPTINR